MENKGNSKSDEELMALPLAGLTRDEAHQRWRALRRKWQEEEDKNPECEFCGSTDMDDYEDCDHECWGTRADAVDYERIEDDHR